ncbi:hypothetical protein [Phytohabitans rumicis]|uniref:Uncharacterized protein n=1 Tax=Phytohabitans rumicis TaxID=1076125 RepID=A0A6V8KY07_9ACTN|nr:hypothetical protein [Phytohabitans rumicis]GFJ87209.1 hypothetical protein Prum_008510 [Phytohabitans rumicis]
MTDLHLTTLTCLRCTTETPHELRYAGRLLVASRCNACGHEMTTADPHRYLLDLGHRAASKPRRMLRRLRRDPGAFLWTLPAAIAVKPVKLARELAIVVRVTEQRRGGWRPDRS